MDKPMPNLMFRCLCLMFALRDYLRPRENILAEVGIKPGFSILDYGCGPGSYALIAAGLVGASGKVYALDIQPLAVQRVKHMAAKKGLSNIETICSDCATGQQDNSMDVILLYDIFHALSEPNEVLRELHRVLKPNGILSFSDHHLKEDNILSGMTNKDLFKLAVKGQKTYSFLKRKQ